MQTIEQKIQQAEALWHQAHVAQKNGQLHKAYDLYTQAHNLVIDCPSYHKQAHVYLRQINWQLGHYGELFTDWALHILSPFKVFELVAFFSRSDARFKKACVTHL